MLEKAAMNQLLGLPGITVTINVSTCLLILAFIGCILILTGKIKLPDNWLQVSNLNNVVIPPLLLLILLRILSNDF